MTPLTWARSMDKGLSNKAHVGRNTVNILTVGNDEKSMDTKKERKFIAIITTTTSVSRETVCSQPYLLRRRRRCPFDGIADDHKKTLKTRAPNTLNVRKMENKLYLHSKIITRIKYK